MDMSLPVTDGDVEHWKQLLATREGLCRLFGRCQCLCGICFAAVWAAARRCSRRHHPLGHGSEILTQWLPSAARSRSS
jgi:hypothetical protein